MRKMKALFEGKKSKIVRGLTASQANSQLIKLLSSRKLSGARLEIIHEVTNKSIGLVEAQLNLTKKHRIDPAGWHLDLEWVKFERFIAQAGSIAQPNVYLIQIALEAPAALLSLANELESVNGLAHQKNHDSSWLFVFKKRISLRFFSWRFAIHSWLMGVDSVSDVSEKTKNRATDAVLLLYFHELSHVMFGHCQVFNPTRSAIRALEADADFNAGSMFAATLVGEGKTVAEIQERMILASLLLGTVLKAISPRSKEYHFPTIRSAMMVEGGAFVLGKIKGLLPAFSSPQEIDDYWSDVRNKYEPGFLLALRSSSMAYFSGTERGLRRDLQALADVTIPLRDQLKESILKEKSILAYLSI